jgi:hypothetical protein
MSMRIGFDMDGVVADMAASVNQQAEAMFGPVTPVAADTATTPPGTDERPVENTDEDTAPELGRQLTRRQQSQLWDRIRQVGNFWDSLGETEPGIVARLWALSQERRWEVIFLTKRPRTAGCTSQMQSHDWLVRHGFLKPSVFVVQGSRGKIAAALDLDLVVDDTPDNCVDVLAESKAKAILVARDPDARIAPSARRLGIGVVGSLSECLDILAETAGTSSERPHFLTRVMQMLGITPQSRRAPRPLADF